MLSLDYQPVSTLQGQNKQGSPLCVPELAADPPGLCCGKVTLGVTFSSSLQSSVLEEGQLAELGPGT